MKKSDEIEMEDTPASEQEEVDIVSHSMDLVCSHGNLFPFFISF